APRINSILRSAHWNLGTATADSSARHVGGEFISRFCSSRKRLIAPSAREQNRASPLGIVRHLRDQRVYLGEPALATDTRDEVDRHMLAVKVGRRVEHVGLDRAGAAGERRVGADGDRGLIPLARHGGYYHRPMAQHGEP